MAGRRRRGRRGEVRGGGEGGEGRSEAAAAAAMTTTTTITAPASATACALAWICARRKHRVRLCKEGMRKGCLIHGKGRAAATWLTISVLLLLAPRLRAPERVKVSSLEQTCAKRAQGER